MAGSKLCQFKIKRLEAKFKTLEILANKLEVLEDKNELTKRKQRKKEELEATIKQLLKTDNISSMDSITLEEIINKQKIPYKFIQLIAAGITALSIPLLTIECMLGCLGLMLFVQYKLEEYDRRRYKY